MYSIKHSGNGYNWAGTVFRSNVFYHPIQLGTGVTMIGNLTTVGSPVPSIPSGANLPPGPVYNPPPLTPPSSSPSTPTVASGGISTTSVIQAENFSATQGAARITNGVGHFDNGDWIEYKGLNFGTGVRSFSAAVAAPAAYAGQKIQLRLDGPNGQLIGTLVPKATAGWFSYALRTINVTKVTGIHDLYLVGVGGSGIANIDYLKFA